MPSYALVRNWTAGLALAMIVLAACSTPTEPAVNVEAQPSTDTLVGAGTASPTGSGQVLLRDTERELYVFAMDLGQETYVTIANEGDEAQSMRVIKPRQGHYELAFATHPDKPYRIQNDETGIIFEISARSGLLLRRVVD